MTHRTGGRTDVSQDEVYRCLADHRRRRILAILDGQSSPVADADLATQLVADEATVAVTDVTDAETERVLVDLRQAQLPMLEDAGLLEYDRDERTVAVAAPELVRDSAVQLHLRTPEESWDPVVSALADRRRRLALSIANERESPLAVRDLARAIADREADGDADAERVHVSLQHRHLPKLADAGLLEFDREEDTVTFVGRPDLADDRLEDALDESMSEDSPLVEAIL